MIKDWLSLDSSVSLFLSLSTSFYLIFRTLSPIPVPCLPYSSPSWLTLGGSHSLRLPFALLFNVICSRTHFFTGLLQEVHEIMGILFFTTLSLAHCHYSGDSSTH